MVEENQTTQNTDHTNNGDNNRGTPSLRLLIGVVVALTIVYGSMILIAIYHPYLNERVKFGTETGLGIAVLIAVIVQAIITNKQWRTAHDGLNRTDKIIEKMQGQLDHDKQVFENALERDRQESVNTLKQLHLMERQSTISETQTEIAAEVAKVTQRQWEVMKGQLDAIERQEASMRDQSKIMGDSLLISQRASVAVHSLKMDKKSRAVVIEVKNTGNVPAEQIKLYFQVFSFMPVDDDGGPFQETKKIHVHEDYGRTKLFQGNVPILLSLFLDWTDKEMELIGDGTCGLVVDGYVDYSDGFAPLESRRNEFYFSYLPQMDAWSAGPAEHGDYIGREDNSDY